jgi:hypothetical protein
VSGLGEKAADAAHATVAVVTEIPRALEGAVDKRKHPKLAAAWSRAQPFVKVSLLGAAFVGGGMLLARWFGGSTARALGREGGEGFARGVNAVNDQIAAMRGGAHVGATHRGSRFNR